MIMLTGLTITGPPSHQLAASAASGVDAEVVSPFPPLLNYALPAGSGRDLARWVSEYIASLCAAAAGRIYGLGTVPLQDPDLVAVMGVDRGFLSIVAQPQIRARDLDELLLRHREVARLKSVVDGLLPLIDDDQDQAVELAVESLGAFRPHTGYSTPLPMALRCSSSTFARL